MIAKRVILFVIDAMKREVFYDLLAEGKLPGFGEIFGDGVRIRYGTTVFPSETLPSQASLFTGCQVKRHKIVSNAWLDREKDPVELRDYGKAATAAAVFGYELFGLPSGILPLRNPLGLANQDLSADVPTIYEAAGWAGLDSVVLFNHYSRGSTQWIRPNRMAVLYFAISHKARLGFRALDAYTMRVATGFIRKNPLPNLMTIYFCGLDAWGHHTGRSRRRSTSSKSCPSRRQSARRARPGRSGRSCCAPKARTKKAARASSPSPRRASRVTRRAT